jgi:hypothetical protein
MSKNNGNAFKRAREARNAANNKGNEKKNDGNKPIYAKKVEGAIPELGVFDYSLGASSVSKFNSARRLLIDYIGREISGEVCYMIEEAEEFPYEEMEEADGNDFTAENDPGGVEKSKWLEELKEYKAELKEHRKNKKKAYSVIYGQCTTALRNQLKTEDDWEEIKHTRDVLRLWQAIMAISIKGPPGETDEIRCARAKSKFASVHQFRDETVTEFYERFQGEVDAYGCV